MTLESPIRYVNFLKSFGAWVRAKLVMKKKVEVLKKMKVRKIEIKR